MTASGGGAIRAAIAIGHLGFGGAERQLTELALRARASGVAPHVFCLGGTEEPFGSVLRSAGVPLTVVARRGAFDAARVLRLAALLRRGRFDVVHSFLIDTNPYALLAARLAGIRPFVASNRNSGFTRGALRRSIDRWSFRSASAVLVNALAVRDFTAANFDVPPERFAVVYNGVDLARFRPREGARGGALQIGTVGALEAKKNPQMFVDVARIVRARFPEVRSLHVGEGPFRPALENGDARSIQFLGGSTATESFLSTLDVFVLTSDREGCPNVLLEAMATGLPVVTTNAGGAAEVVRDGETGYVTPRGDREAMANKVCALLAAPALRARLGATARREAERHFSVERMVRETVGLYRMLVERRGRPAL